MKTLKNIFAALVLITFATVNVHAQTNPVESATADASATIITPIDIKKEADLSFGNIIASNAAGTVVVDFSNGRTRTGGATFPTVNGTITTAAFKVTGLANALYTITLPNDTEVKLDGPGVDMNVISFTHNANEQIATNSEEVFQVGATLEVNANQAAGDYKGSFDVTVNYN